MLAQATVTRARPLTIVWVGIKYSDYPSLTQIMPLDMIEQIRKTPGYTEFKKDQLLITEFTQDNRVVGIGVMVQLIGNETESVDVERVQRAIHETRRIFTRLNIKAIPLLHITASIVPSST